MSPGFSRLERRDEDVPTNRLGRIAAAMLKAAEEHPEYRETDRALVLLDDDVEHRGLAAQLGYAPDEGPDALVNLLGHLDTLAQAGGIDMQFIAAPRPGQG